MTPAGVFSSAAGPTQVIRPFSARSAAAGHRRPAVAVDEREVAQRPACSAAGAGGGRRGPPPARPHAAAATAERRPTATRVIACSRGRLRGCASRARIEDPARAEAAQVAQRLLGGATAFLHPVDHLLGERHADHAVSAHRRKRQHVAVRQVLGLAFEAERVADAVARDAGRVAALLGAVDRGRDVDAEPRSASVTALTKSSAASRSSNTAAAVVAVSRPSMTASKSGVMSRFQCDSRVHASRTAAARRRGARRRDSPG